ncbi:Repressor of RNA polymerase III transcription Maf1 [Phytophthora cactorum]|nr:Repressor of RNA polymerase III transcription Maf1 [Phytophthora cactorum]
MKYLEEPQLSWLNSVLGSYEIGDRVLNGKIETYSCKKRSLELYYQQEIEAAADLLGSSPLGPIAAPATRKLLINLISTMNASFPDYDFSASSPNSSRINHDLAELLEAEGNGFVEKIYIPDMDSDPFSDGNLYVVVQLLLLQQGAKKVLYFTCLCKGLTYDSDMDDETMEEPTAVDDDEKTQWRITSACLRTGTTNLEGPDSDF